jgi:hypothetical protein
MVVAQRRQCEKKPMMKSTYRTLAVLTLLAVVPGMAHAQSQAARQACRADYSKLCPGTSPGGGRIAACLKEHADKLSPECKDSLKAAQAK